MLTSAPARGHGQRAGLPDLVLVDGRVPEQHWEPDSPRRHRVAVASVLPEWGAHDRFIP